MGDQHWGSWGRRWTCGSDATAHSHVNVVFAHCDCGRKPGLTLGCSQVKCACGREFLLVLQVKSRGAPRRAAGARTVRERNAKQMH